MDQGLWLQQQISVEYNLATEHVDRDNFMQYAAWIILSILWTGYIMDLK